MKESNQPGKTGKAAKKSWPVMVLFLLVGAVCGILISRSASLWQDAGAGPAQVGLYFVLLLIGLIVAMGLQIILHEAGHGLAGRLCGYRLVSFRVGSLMWVREQGSWRLRRFSLAGTGGQCLMAPAALAAQTDLSCCFYLLGGSLMNLLCALLFLGLFRLCPAASLESLFLLELALVGGAFALTNGIPLRLGTIDNDGYSARSLWHDPAARQAFWRQMKINQQISAGMRLKDMPEEWFAWPDQAGMNNALIAATAVFACNRLLDAGDIAGAAAAIDHLLATDSALPGLYRYLLSIDRLYCTLVGAGEPLSAELDTAELRKFRKSMAKYPSVLRLDYVEALSAGEEAAAARAKAAFDSMAARYPYPCEIVGERELMEYGQEALACADRR